MDTVGAGNLIPIIATVIGSHGLLAVVLVGIALRLGGLPTRRELNALRDEVAANKVELKEDVAAVKLEILNAKAELRQEIADAKTELRQEIADARRELEAKIDAARDEVLQEIRRSHRQMMLALANHTHNANGQAMFALPPETEPVPAPADN